MNRRTALWWSLLAGGLWPAQAWAQDKPRRSRVGSARSERPIEDDEPESPGDIQPPAPSVDQGPPPGFPTEPGFTWRTVDISRYTNLPHVAPSPQAAIIEWIFRVTGSDVWHGDKIAVLCASHTQLRAYNHPSILKKVDEVLERFLDVLAKTDYLSVHMQIVAASDPRWRVPHFGRLTPLGSGPQGQKIWTLSMRDAAMILAQMQVNQGFTLLVDQKNRVINGQTFTVKSLAGVDYISGPQRDAPVGLGLQPGAGKLEEGVSLRISPLLTYDADGLEAAIDLRTNLVRRLHAARILTRREVGPGELTIDVPEVSETRLNQTIKGWKLGQTLLISAGVQPGLLLPNKNGFLNLRIPGTVPTSTELLAFIDVTATAGEPPARTARAREKDKERERDLEDDRREP